MSNALFPPSGDDRDEASGGDHQEHPDVRDIYAGANRAESDQRATGGKHVLDGRAPIKDGKARRLPFDCSAGHARDIAVATVFKFIADRDCVSHAAGAKDLLK